MHILGKPQIQECRSLYEITIHTRTHTHTESHTNTHIHVYFHIRGAPQNTRIQVTFRSLNIYTRTHADTHSPPYIQIQVSFHVSSAPQIQVCRFLFEVKIYEHIHARTCTCAHAHTYIHTETSLLSSQRRHLDTSLQVFFFEVSRKQVSCVDLFLYVHSSLSAYLTHLAYLGLVM